MLQELKNREFKKPVSTAYGLTNKCADGEYILFADYDKVYLHVLLKELDNIFKKHKKYLTNFAIFESTKSISTKNGTLGSYHVVSFAKLPYQKMREILSYLSIDDDFYKLPQNTPYRANTLRISPKYEYQGFSDADTKDGTIIKDAPKFVCWFPEGNNIPKVKVSGGHLKTYEHLINNFDMPDNFLDYDLDLSAKIELKQYDSLGC